MTIRNDLLGGNDWQDTGVTTLDGVIDDSITTITVLSTTTFKASGIIRIDDEKISYSGSTATTFTGCVRGIGDTTAVSHLDTTTVNEKERFDSDDLNDTLDAMANATFGLTTFYLNTFLYDVYDDFDSYSTGAFTTTADWTVTLTSLGGGAGTTATCDIQASTYTYDTGKEIKIAGTQGSFSNGYTAVLESKTLLPNKHTFIRVRGAVSQGNTTLPGCSFSFGGSSFGLARGGNFSFSGNNVEIMIVNTGTGDYDVYINSFKEAELTEISDADAAKLNFTVSHGSADAAASTTASIIINDIRQSKGGAV